MYVRTCVCTVPSAQWVQCQFIHLVWAVASEAPLLGLQVSMCVMYVHRSHNELQKECSRLEQKSHEQEGCVLALEATAGQVEQRCRELERQVKGVQWRHKRAMKTIFNIVMETEGEEGLVGMEEEVGVGVGMGGVWVVVVWVWVCSGVGVGVGGCVHAGSSVHPCPTG